MAAQPCAGGLATRNGHDVRAQPSARICSRPRTACFGGGQTGLRGGTCARSALARDEHATRSRGKRPATCYRSARRKQRAGVSCSVEQHPSGRCTRRIRRTSLFLGGLQDCAVGNQHAARACRRHVYGGRTSWARSAAPDPSGARADLTAGSKAYSLRGNVGLCKYTTRRDLTEGHGLLRLARPHTTPRIRCMHGVGRRSPTAAENSQVPQIQVTFTAGATHDCEGGWSFCKRAVNYVS